MRRICELVNKDVKGVWHIYGWYKPGVELIDEQSVFKGIRKINVVSLTFEVESSEVKEQIDNAELALPATN